MDTATAAGGARAAGHHPMNVYVREMDVHNCSTLPLHRGGRKGTSSRETQHTYIGPQVIKT